MPDIGLRFSGIKKMANYLRMSLSIAKGVTDRIHEKDIDPFVRLFCYCEGQQTTLTFD